MAQKLPPHLAIDFGNHTLKLAYLTGSGKKWDLKALGEHETPQGALNSYKDEHKEQLVEAVKELVSDAKVPVKEVAVALPENAVFSRVLTLPKLNDYELSEAVYWQLKQYLPYPIEEVQSDFTELSLDAASGQRKVLAVAAPKKLVGLYVEILEKAGLKPVAIESETLSILRTVKMSHEVQESIVLDFGALSTDMAIMSNGELYFSQSISTGSDLLTKAIVNEFQLSYAQAEEYKKTYGMQKNAVDGKIFNVLKPVLDMIITEVLRGLEFYKSELSKVPPRIIFLSGEGAMLPALDEYITSILNIEAAAVNPWQKVSVPQNLAQLANDGYPGYSVAVGLCIKEE